MKKDRSKTQRSEQPAIKPKSEIEQATKIQNKKN
jgi:hypothetical protein